VIKVPFPYTGRPVRQRRPALVVAARRIQQDHGLLWVLMITSAENRGWAGDVAITNLSMAGLPAASVVRTAKIATIEAKEAEVIGHLPDPDRGLVARQLEAELPSLTD
ncbi:MAG TPA: type II toxin-antitoxin system PemK/MazF family toxin, partial [Rhodospirillaceae bacterium]|nr:type II toxin-antitoxin system PemK/MazF family toxin [Rhodospirillaceae bacterium]